MFELIRRLRTTVELLSAMESIRKDYHKILANLNQPVRVLDGGRSFEGICRGIDEKGELLVEKQDKEIAKVSAGEVSVRGLYSYV